MAMGEKDSKGGFVRSSFKTSNDVELAVYTWAPPCGIEAARGCCFVLHGIFGHTRFEFLEPDEDNRRVLYSGSIIEALNNEGMLVIGHDNPSHGLSSGERGYWRSFDVLRDAAIEFYEDAHKREDLFLQGKKTFFAGMSMGGTIGIEVCRKRPDLFSGYVLYSPACQPPDDSFGLYGRFLQSVSGVLNKVVPTWSAINLPPSDDLVIRDACEKDELVQKTSLRVRVGCEFLRVYRDISANAESIVFPDVLVFVGEGDNIVSPSGIKEFVAKISSSGTKEMFVCTGLAHEVLREVGREVTHEKTIAWFAERLAS